MKTVNEKLECFDISRVSVTEPYLMHSLELETEYLLSLDADRWLAGFRETAGLDMEGCERYGGWENLLIGGHAFGHYLSACSQACKSPDIAAADKEELLKGSELRINVIPAVTHCGGCGCEYGTVLHGKTCPQCGSGDTWLLRGNEVEIKEIEVPDN